MLSLIPSRSMYGLRSSQAPEPQNAPALSAEKDWATSGDLPPRLAAMILSSLMPPTTLTLICGFAFSNSATAFLMTPSSRAVKPTHSVMSAGASFSPLAAGAPRGEPAHRGGAGGREFLPLARGRAAGGGPVVAGPPAGGHAEREEPRRHQPHRQSPHAAPLSCAPSPSFRMRNLVR